MSYQVEILPAARIDVYEAIAFEEEKRSGGSYDFEEQLAEILLSLEENPYLYQTVFDEVRKAFRKGFRYHIIYRVEDTEVLIIGVRHERSNPDTWMSR